MTLKDIREKWGADWQIDATKWDEKKRTHGAWIAMSTLWGDHIELIKCDGPIRNTRAEAVAGLDQWMTKHIKPPKSREVYPPGRAAEEK